MRRASTDQKIWLAAGVAGFHFRVARRTNRRRLMKFIFRSIIISSSGMVTGGRILHHLAQRLPDPEEYGALHRLPGPGHARRDHQERRQGSEDLRRLRARFALSIATFEQFSDHADPPELLEWLHTFQKKPTATYLVHGEAAASSQLRDAMTKELGWNVQVAEWMQKVDIR